MGWDREALEARGFRGFVRFADLPHSNVPHKPGVYVVYREADHDPRFNEASLAGWFKGRDPTVAVALLSAAWVPAAHVLNIGKASGGATARRGLDKRLDEYRRFGAGEAIGHYGGRYIWQLFDAQELLVAWMETPGADPASVEGELIAEFVRDHGVRPFANRNSGRQPIV